MPPSSACWRCSSFAADAPQAADARRPPVKNRRRAADDRGVTQHFVPRTVIASVVGTLGLIAMALPGGCAHQTWPDEPGVPVALVSSDNLAAEDAFLETLTSRRRAANLGAPIVAAAYQGNLRNVARDLQAGKASVAASEQALVKLARAAHRSEMKTFTLDCAAGANMQMPSTLVDEPALVISYAAAHFRPRSLATPQCVVLGTILSGVVDQVDETKL